MAVFDQQSITNTEMATGLGQSDYSLATNYPKGAAPLNDPTFTFDTWLPGTTGVDCKLVHGDRWQEIEGNMSQHVAQTKWSKYDGDFTETYGGTGGTGTVTRTMNGYVGESYCATAGCDRTYTGHATDTYHAGHSQHNDVEEVETRKWKVELVDSASAEIAPFKLEVVWGIGLNFAGVLEISVAAAHIEAGAIAASFHAYDRGEAELKEDIKLLDSRLDGANLSIGVLFAQLPTLKAVAAPVVVETATDAIIAGA